MTQTSEWVSIGHPDKMADYISEYILDRFLERDPRTRYALEVQIKDNTVCLGGEITSKADITNGELKEFVRAAIEEIGYTHEYAEKWQGKCTNADKIETVINIGRQSPDIAKGVDRGGWGDQGIYWGMAVNTPKTDYMPIDIYLARRIGQELYGRRIAGIDIKTMVAMENGLAQHVVVAIPTRDAEQEQLVREIASRNAEEICGVPPDRIIVNGTGRYFTHGSVGDCGTTGRKLAVDFYGGNCPVGGGSPWTKDGTKADLSLNMMARESAMEQMTQHGFNTVRCALSSIIGQPRIGVAIFAEKHGRSWEDSYMTECDPEELIERFHLRQPIFTGLCRTGLPYFVQ